MDSSDSTASSGINGGAIRIKNRRCDCGKTAGIRISNTARNPRKLYFHCQQEPRCDYWRWWVPDEDEVSLETLAMIFKDQTNRRTRGSVEEQAVPRHMGQTQLDPGLVMALERVHTQQKLMYLLMISFVAMMGLLCAFLLRASN